MLLAWLWNPPLGDAMHRFTSLFQRERLFQREALLLCVLALAACALCPPAVAQDFDPLDPAVLQRTTPKLDPTADAEYILRSPRLKTASTAATTWC